MADVKRRQPTSHTPVEGAPAAERICKRASWRSWKHGIEEHDGAVGLMALANTGAPYLMD